MTDKKKATQSIKTLAEDLRKFRESRRKFTPERIKELNELLEGPSEKTKLGDDQKSARPLEKEA
ncbi:MAG: hypothetical protein KF802_04250 [Bdellovibrionaceae bacterium]|nr:hypothetical protein [Pseudobdellovibrionaceae bacterium]